jgi:hypothetical protein
LMVLVEGDCSSCLVCVTGLVGFGLLHCISKVCSASPLVYSYIHYFMLTVTAICLWATFRVDDIN